MVSLRNTLIARQSLRGMLGGYEGYRIELTEGGEPDKIEGTPHSEKIFEKEKKRKEVSRPERTLPCIGKGGRNGLEGERLMRFCDTGDGKKKKQQR